MPSNKRIIVPKSTSTDEVTVFANISSKVLAANNEYIAKNCDVKNDVKIKCFD